MKTKNHGHLSVYLLLLLAFLSSESCRERMYSRPQKVPVEDPQPEPPKDSNWDGSSMSGSAMGDDNGIVNPSSVTASQASAWGITRDNYRTMLPEWLWEAAERLLGIAAPPEPEVLNPRPDAGLEPVVDAPLGTMSP